MLASRLKNLNLKTLKYSFAIGFILVFANEALSPRGYIDAILMLFSVLPMEIDLKGILSRKRT